MTESEILEFAAGLPGVRVMTADEASGAPEIAWGDSFVFLEPDDQFPFATIVIKDYTGFDEASQVDREGVFRVNLNVGRELFTSLFGFKPAAFDEHRDAFDWTVLDTVIPHPVYGQQAWVSVLNPGPRTSDQVRTLLVAARDRAATRRPGER